MSDTITRTAEKITEFGVSTERNVTYTDLEGNVLTVYQRSEVGRDNEYEATLRFHDGTYAPAEVAAAVNVAAKNAFWFPAENGTQTKNVTISPLEAAHQQLSGQHNTSPAQGRSGGR